MVLTSDGKIIYKMVLLHLMHEEHLNAPNIKRKKYSSYKGETSIQVENIIQRDYHADKPNEKWLIDITGFSILSGKMDLSPIIVSLDEKEGWKM